MPTTIAGMEDRRRAHQRFRADILHGDWSSYVIDRNRREVGTERAAQWGEACTTSNVAGTIVRAQAVVHDRAGYIGHADPAAAAGMALTLEQADWWPLSQGIEADMVGINEVLCHVDTDEAGGVTLTPIRPHLVEATPHPRRRREAIKLRWQRMRYNLISKTDEECWDTWSIEPGAEYFRCEDQHGTDISAKFGVAPERGAAYRWRRADGTAIIPVAWWHRYLTDGLWNPLVNSALFHATVAIASALTYYEHLVARASWAQRYTIGADIQGETPITEDADPTTVVGQRRGRGSRASAIEADPAVVISLVRSEDYDGQPIAGQWAVSSQPSEVLAGIISRVEWVATEFGGPAAEVSGANHDARSAYAIVMSRAAQREQAQRLEPACRRGDLELLSIVATVLRVHGGPALPESGWTITYTPLPKTQEELAAEREQLDWALSKGLAGPITAYLELHPGITRAEAVERIIAIRGEEAELTPITANTEEKPNGNPGSPDSAPPADPESGDAPSVDDPAGD